MQLSLRDIWTDTKIDRCKALNDIFPIWTKVVNVNGQNGQTKSPFQCSTTLWTLNPVMLKTRDS